MPFLSDTSHQVGTSRQGVWSARPATGSSPIVTTWRCILGTSTTREKGPSSAIFAKSVCGTRHACAFICTTTASRQLTWPNSAAKETRWNMCKYNSFSKVNNFQGRWCRLRRWVHRCCLLLGWFLFRNFIVFPHIWIFKYLWPILFFWLGQLTFFNAAIK